MAGNERLKEDIRRLKEDRNALILAHNYQIDDVQDIADYTGDSLELSRKAADTDFDIIVFCGVRFMAESAAILSPDKTVLLPASNAFCPMAEMVTVNSQREIYGAFPGYSNPPQYVYPPEFTLDDIRKQYPDTPVVAYVNTTAEVKAHSDICCTSANVVKVINSLPADRVICIPDKNLSMWAAKNTDKEVIAWDGYCHVHDRIRPADVEKARSEHPNAMLMAHPECRLDVLMLADHVTSTSGMLRFAQTSDAKEFIVGTEVGLMYRLRKENPDKTFYPLRKDMLCPNMKKTNLQSVYDALVEMKNIIRVEDYIRHPARIALDRMLAI
ncbi:quinolinate synthase [Candidatus Magnetobacterium casense]|uniref:Quinolinate synthase n=1 Tax=Candidatus Magnetobacterium casense TaxID=1455061 RepID=A0ABS6RW29_9BACT|nr:quinolinate synthase [Candidatus Magnetobacterium casensis]MBV6340835.1 quinolinate synthase [Candidatus Magnetobacterium casensis]